MMKPLQRLVSRFRRDTFGGVAIMAGFSIALLGTSVIAAVDVADMKATKNKMQDRLDSAVLFATLQESLREAGSEADLQDAGRNFVLEAVKNAGIRAEDIVTSFTYDVARDRIVGEVTFTPPALFVGAIVAPRGMTLRAEGAPLQPQKMEVSLILDVSGSMNWSITSDMEAPVGSRRIDALREGVETLITSLDEAPRLEPNFAVIPYATSVDITGLLADAGANQTVWFEGVNGSDLPDVCQRNNPGQGNGNAYGHCKDKGKNTGEDKNNGDGDNSVSNPSPTGAWGAERYVAKNGSSFTLTADAPAGSRRVPVVTQPTRETFCDQSYIEAFGDLCVEFVKIDGQYYSEKGYFAPRSGVLPLTDQPQTVLNFMNSIEAEGGTAGHIGAAWGLYSLTKEWNDVFNHPAGEPSEFNSETQKVMIMMTDGDFTITHDDSMAIPETYEYFQSVCSMAKARGVIVYTVGLRASQLTDTQLTRCSGSKDRYFPADSRAALVNAFEEIAANATRARLSY